MFFFFNDTATTEIYTLSLHDALPIFRIAGPRIRLAHRDLVRAPDAGPRRRRAGESVPSQPRPFAGAMGRPSEWSPGDRSRVPPPVRDRPCPVRVGDRRRARQPDVAGCGRPVLARPERPLVRRPWDSRHDPLPLPDL